jgi:hypothetical protein
MAAAISLCAFPGRARADEATDAAGHFQSGLRHAQAGDLNLAALEFQRAYAASPHYSVLYNLGQTYMLLGRPAEAVDAFQRYLEQGGENIDERRRRAVESSILFQSKRLGELAITIEPKEARVELDGELVAPSSKPLSVAAGRHGLLFTAPGHAPHGESVLVEAGRLSKLGVRLEPLAVPAAKLAQLHVVCGVPDVAVHLDGRALGDVSRESLFGVAAGHHRVAFQRAGYDATEQTVELRAAQATTVQCRLRPRTPLPPDQRGELRVRVSEPESSLSLDGEPFSDGAVPIGRHRVEARRFGFKPWHGTVAVGPNQPVSLTIMLEPEPEFVESQREAAQQRRTLSYVLGGGGIAFGGAALTLWLVGRNEHDEWLEQKTDLEAAPPGSDVSAELQAFHEQTVTVQRLNDWAVGCAIVGGAFLAAGTALFVSAADTERYGSLGARVSKNSSELSWTRAW